MFTMMKCIFTKKEVQNKTSTPMIGYLLKNEETGEIGCYSRRESFDLINVHGSSNVEAKSRGVSCEEDLPDQNGKIYYLKLKSKETKINDYLLDVKELPQVFITSEMINVINEI